MQINIVNGVQMPLTVQENTEVGHIRSLHRELEEIGAPSTFTFAVNGVGVEDNHILAEGDNVSFRPITGTKGA
jgi:hypothetical protein